MKITAVYNNDGLVEFNVRPIGTICESGDVLVVSQPVHDRIMRRLGGLGFQNFYAGGISGQDFRKKVTLYVA